MGKLIVTEFVTLDGVAQAPGGPDEDRDGDFTHGGWQASLPDEEAGSVIFEQARTMDALLLGRRTYEIFAGYWPTAPEEIPFTGLLNRVPKYVASRTLADPLAWHGSTLLAESIAGSVTSLKERHDELHVIGSLNLVQSLLRSGLVDRLNLWLYPLLLGRGKHVFADGTAPTALRLTESVTYASGILHLAHETSARPHIATSEVTNGPPGIARLRPNQCASQLAQLMTSRAWRKRDGSEVQRLPARLRALRSRRMAPWTEGWGDNGASPPGGQLASASPQWTTRSATPSRPVVVSSGSAVAAVSYSAPSIRDYAAGHWRNSGVIRGSRTLGDAYATRGPPGRPACCVKRNCPQYRGPRPGWRFRGGLLPWGVGSDEFATRETSKLS